MEDIFMSVILTELLRRTSRNAQTDTLLENSQSLSIINVNNSS